MRHYGRDFSDQQFWARSQGFGYGGRDYGDRNFGSRSYGYDFRDYPGRGYYSGPSHYWGSGFEGGYDRGFAGGGYDRDLRGSPGGDWRQRMGRRGGRQERFGYYGQGIDDGLESLYSGTYRNHGPIGRSSNGEELIYPPEHRSQGDRANHRMGGQGRQRYDRGW